MRSEGGQPKSEPLPIGWRHLYPELIRWGIDGQRRRALKPGHRDAFRQRWGTATCFWIIGVAVIKSVIDGADYISGSALVRAILMPVVGCTTFAVVFIAYRLWQRQRVRTSLRRQLVSIGRLVCIHCGYNLTGNVSGRCPECGEAA